MADQPHDACPYLRPFADDFDECPAYRRARFLPLDVQRRPIRPVNTCVHLEASSVPGRRAAYYARCGVGDAAARRSRVERLDPDRLDLVRRLSTLVTAETQETAAWMWDAKSQHLRAVRAGSGVREAWEAVEEAAAAYEEAVARVVAGHHDEIEQLGVSAQAVQALLREAVLDWANRSTDEVYRPSREILERLPPEVATFLSADE